MPTLRSWLPGLLLPCAAPSFGQGTSFFSVCNAGKVAVDAYLATQGQVIGKHVGPADCEFLVKGTGGLAGGTLGFAFADAKGQWRGARRGDLLPFWEADLGGNNFSAVKRTQAMQHNGASVTIPMIVAFGPKTPVCTQPVINSARANLPLNATTTQRILAEQADRQAAANSAPVCSAVGDQLTVIPYADSGEIGYDTQCDPCTEKRIASMTPEQKDAEERRATAIESQVVSLAAMPGIGGFMMRNVVQGVSQQQKEDEQNERDRAEVAKGPWTLTWQQYPDFVTSAFDVRGAKPLIANRHVVMRGTISCVELPNPGAQTPWIHVYFKDSAKVPKPDANLPGDYFINDWLRAEKPEGVFAICELGADVFPEVFGADWSTAMVGKTVELEGELNRGTCATAAGIRIALARQLKVVTPGMTASAARPWDVSLAPQRPAAAAVTPAPTQSPAPASAAARAAATRGAAKAPETATASNASTPAPAAAPVTGVTPRPQAPAAAPAAPVKPAASPVVENAIALLRGKVPQYRILDQVHRSNQPHTLTGDERARLEDAGASERLLQAIEKPADIKLEEMQPPRSSPANRQAIVACQRKAAQDNPRDAQARIQAIRACMTN